MLGWVPQWCCGVNGSGPRRRLVVDRAVVVCVGAGCVVPAGPLGDGDLDRVDSGPGALVADELGLVQGVEAYQGIVVGAC